MTTTNYEISKQLAEAGFEAEAHHKLHCFKENTLYSYYDLETILEALPKTVVLKTIPKKIYELRVWFNSNENQIGYQDFQGFHPVLTVAQQENESLADVAAKLWLKLKKEGLYEMETTRTKPSQKLC